MMWMLMPYWVDSMGGGGGGLQREGMPSCAGEGRPTRRPPDPPCSPHPRNGVQSARQRTSDMEEQRAQVEILMNSGERTRMRMLLKGLGCGERTCDGEQMARPVNFGRVARACTQHRSPA